MPEGKQNTLLSYSTTVSVAKTVHEIQALLASKGALSVNIEYKDGEPSGLTFVLPVFGRPLNFRIPANPEAAYEVLYTLTGVPRWAKTREQAKKVCWRVLLRWVEAQLAIVQLKQASFDRAFFQYALDETTGKTVYEHWAEARKELKDAPEQPQLKGETG